MENSSKPARKPSQDPSSVSSSRRSSSKTSSRKMSDKNSRRSSRRLSTSSRNTILDDDKSGDEEGVEATQTVDLWFVRHGESKNNKILKSAGGLGTLLYPIKFSQDPLLTVAGIDGARANGQRLQQAQVEFDLVFCSCMMRAMETAYFMLVETNLTEKVYIAPYVSEVPLTWAGIPIYENLPLPRKDQIKTLGIQHNASMLKALDWSLVGGVDDDNADCLPPSGDDFLQWLYHQPVFKSLSEKSEINIAVVTHSHFMKRDALQLSSRPANADVFSARMLVLEHTAAAADDQKPQDGAVADGKPHLVLTNLEAWYLEKHAMKEAKLDGKIARKARRFERKQDKINRRLAALESSNISTSMNELRLLDGDDPDADAVTAAELAASGQLSKSERKAVKKMNKLTNKLQAKEKKFNSKRESLTRRKENLATGTTATARS